MRKYILFILMFTVLLSSAGCSNLNKDLSENISLSSKHNENISNDVSVELLDKTWFKDIKVPNQLHIMVYFWANPVVVCKENIYYVTAKGITKMPSNYSKKEQIVTNTEIYGLYIYKDELYYNTEKSIYKYNESSHKSELIWSINHTSQENYQVALIYGCYDFYLDEDALYVQTSSDSLLKIDINTKQDTVFLEDRLYHKVIGEICYFNQASTKYDGIFAKNLITGETKKVRGDNRDRYDDLKERYDGLAAIRNNLYYTMHSPKSGLFKYNDSGEDETIILLENENDYMIMGQNINNEKFYYTVRTDNKYTIYEYTKTGSKFVLTTDNLSGYFVADKYLFYKEKEESNFKMRIIS